MTTIDRFTLATLPLEQYFGEVPLGQGTGFIWEVNDKFYLVTNWHVLSMRDFFTRKNLHPSAGRPDRLHILFNIRTGSFDKQPWTIVIRDKDDKASWLIHPSARVDIAVLPLPSRPAEINVALHPLNKIANAKLRLEVGMEVFVLGYPFKIEPPAYPVWKRGSIASEPQLARLTTGYGTASV